MNIEKLTTFFLALLMVTYMAIVITVILAPENPYDLNNDGKVTVEDVSILSSHVER